MTTEQRIHAARVLRAARIHQELTQFKVAVMVGVSPQAIWLCERGAASPRMFQAVAKVLKVKLAASDATSSQPSSRE